MSNDNGVGKSAMRDTVWDPDAIDRAWCNNCNTLHAGPTPCGEAGYRTPEQYGAAGDGSVDDTAAIQAAIDS